MKYIDADKLIAEIKRLDKENKELLKSGGSIGREFLFGIGAGYADIIKIVTSLQQEQPEVDLSEENITKEFHIINDRCFNEGIVGWQKEKLIARHFYELGINARKEK